MVRSLTPAVVRLRFAIPAGLTAIGLLVVSWVLVKHDDPGNSPLAIVFKGYERSDDGSNSVAVMWLTNLSWRTFEYISANGMSSNGAEIVLCEFSDKTDSGWTNFINSVPWPRYTSYTLPPHSGTFVAARIANPGLNHGRVRKIAVLCMEPPRRLSGALERLRRLWWRINPPRITSMKVWCETELSISSK